MEKAEIRFIDEVIRRHPKSRQPSVTGNCQTGWALAMLLADRPGTTGPIVLNGSPLSYWAGIEGKDTMRYLGGLVGGIWLVYPWGYVVLIQGCNPLFMKCVGQALLLIHPSPLSTI